MPESLNEPPHSHCLTRLRLAGNCTAREKGMIAVLDIDDPMTGLIESRLRRHLRKQGFRLIKSRARNPLAADFGHYCIYDVRKALLYGTPRTKNVMNINEVAGFAQIERGASGG